MAVDLFLPASQRLDLAALDELLALHRGNTAEEILQSEGQIISFLTEKITRRREVGKYDSPSMGNFSTPRLEEWLQAKILKRKLDELERIRGEYAQSRQKDLTGIDLIFRRIKQKSAIIDLLSNNTVKWAVSESFNDDSRIDSYTGTICDGAFLLPVRREVSVTPSSLVIDSGSKGTPGASDSIDPKLQDPRSMFDSDDGTWFEFFSDRDVRLNLTCRFESLQVLNALIIEPEDTVTVENIWFDGTKSIQELTSGLRTFRVEGRREICHLPVRCSSVTIQMSGRKSIAIKQIQFLRRTFDSKGEVLSKPWPLPSSYYGAEVKVRALPPAAGSTQISFDGNQWQEGLVQMTGSEDQVQFRYSIDNKGFSESFSQPPGSPQTLLRSLSGASSPTQVSLPSKPWKGLVWAVQPRLGRKTDSVAQARLLTRAGSDGALAVPLPVKIQDKLRVYVNRILWEEVTDEASLTGGSYLIADDMIYFSADVPVGAAIRFSLEEERVLFEQKSDGYYYTLNRAFDPDVSSIQVRGLPKDAKTTTIQLPFGETKIDLGAKNIGSIDLAGKNTYQAVASRALLASSGDYYLDRVNGTLYLYEAVTDDDVKLTYTDSDFLIADDVEVVLDEAGAATGIKITDIQASEIVHTVGQSPQLVFDVLAGGRSARENIFSSNPRAEVLSYSSIVRGSFVVPEKVFGQESTEVAFIDGFSEFQGLIPMHDEKTIEIAPDANGLVEFNLAAGRAWYSPLGISTTDSGTFSTLQASKAAVVNVGDYYVDPASGRVTVKTGSTNLKADIGIRYYYRDLEFDSSGLFSVDYENGYFYSSESMQVGSTFSYKTAQYKVAYDLARVIPVLEVSGKRVLLKTDEMSPANNLVRLFWREEVSEGEDLKEYFSPIVESISVKFA